MKTAKRTQYTVYNHNCVILLVTTSKRKAVHEAFMYYQETGNATYTEQK